MSPLRPGSFLDRLQKASTILFGREERAGDYAPAPFLAAYAGISGIQHPFKPIESLDYYGDNPWLYAGVSLIAQEASRVKLKLFQRKKGGDAEEVFDHQALATINRPAPIDGGKTILTHMQLKQLLFTHLKLNGEGFLLLDGRLGTKYGNAPTVLHPLLPAFVLEQLDVNFQIDHYIYRAAGRQIELDPLDVVHFKDPDPKMWYRGHSPVKPMRWALDAHKEADILNYRQFLNGAIPGGVLQTDQKIGAEESKRLLDQWNQQFGGSRNANKTALLPQNLKYQRTQQTNQEMQYAELKNLTRDEILAALRIPIEMLGKTDSQTRANAEVSNYVFQRFTILPIVETFVDTLNNDYLPAFPKYQDLFFGFEPFVPEDLETKRQNTATLFSIGGLMPDEGRTAFGLDPLNTEASKKTYVSFNLTPLDSASLPVDADIEADLEGDETDEEDEVEEDGDEEDRQRRATDDTGDDEELPQDVSAFFDKEKEKQSLAVLAIPFLLQGFRKGIDLANAGDGTPVKPDDIFTANVRRAIERRSLAMAAKTVETTEEQLRQVLIQARADGIGVRALASRINDLYGESMGYRSVRIARTELTGVINDGAMQTYDEQGYTQKTWSTTLDGHERDAHGEADGQTVGMNEPFQVGGSLAMYPGDPNLPAELLINCRCIMQPAGEPEDRSRKILEMFLRLHGSLETRFVASLQKEFKKQRGRIRGTLLH